MQWLTALLAFAVTMLIFAIVVSTFVEMIHRFVGLRAQGMRLMLENLYQHTISPRLTSGQKPTAAEFASIIMENRAMSSEANRAGRGRLSRLLHWLVDSSVMTDIPVEVFTQKLADNRIVSAADNWTDEVIADIGQKFEAFGKEAGTYFERRARVFSIIVAFLVAWAFYVHPYNLAVTYIKNPEVAQAVADKAAEAHAEYRLLAEKLANAQEAANASGASSEELREAIEDFNAKIDAAKAKTQELADMGVPVGWPGSDLKIRTCFAKPEAEDAFIAGFCRMNLPVLGVTAIPSFGNIFWLLVGGLLVGLGAPFWAQAVSSLTASRDVTNKIKDIVNPGQASGPLGARAIGGGKVTSVETFNVARKAQGLPTRGIAPVPPAQTGPVTPPPQTTPQAPPTPRGTGIRRP